LVSCQSKLEDHSTSTERAFPRLDPNNYNVALLVLNGTYNTELTAPMDIFQHTVYRDNIKPMNVFTISDTYDAITTFEE